VTAEGIETSEELEVVQGLDCDEGQGYLFLRPKPSDEITEFIQQQHERPARGVLAASGTLSESDSLAA
jgi:EAL domain-containing protein (putative c-di-GMP-specific phosphodiesterase class I)